MVKQETWKILSKNWIYNQNLSQSKFQVMFFSGDLNLKNKNVNLILTQNREEKKSQIIW